MRLPTLCLCLILGILCLLATPAQAAPVAPAYTGSAKMADAGDESAEFIKSVLITQALKGAISQALEENKMDSSKFWDQYNLGLEKLFTKTRERLTKNLTNVPSNDSNARARAQHELQVQEWKMQNSYFQKQLGRVVANFKIIKQEGPAKGKPQVSLDLQAQLDLQRLTSLYQQLINPKSKRAIDLLVVLPEIDWGNGAEFLSAEQMATINKTIEEHWNQTIKNSLPSNLAPTILLLPSSLAATLSGTADINEGESYYQRLIRLLRQEVTGLQLPSQTAPTALTPLDPNKIDQAAFVQVRMRTLFGRQEKLLIPLHLRLEGQLLLHDLGGQEITSAETIGPLEYDLAQKDPTAFASEVANLIYNGPLPLMRKQLSRMNDFPEQVVRAELSILNYKNVNTLELLSDRLARLSLSAPLAVQIAQIKGRVALLELRYQGPREKLEAMLKTLAGTKIGLTQTLSFPEENNFYKIILSEESLPSKEGLNETAAPTVTTPQ